MSKFSISLRILSSQKRHTLYRCTVIFKSVDPWSSMRKAVPCVLVLLGLVVFTIAGDDSFSLSRGRYAALLSTIAYEKGSDITSWSCRPCREINRDLVDDIRLLGTENRVFGFSLEWNQQQTVVVFRGTDNIRNWILNVDIFFTEYPSPECPQCQIHEGFLSMYQKYLESSVREIVVQKNPFASFVFTGHSLGGAFAVIAASEYYRLVNGTQSPQLYLFGSPRIGNREFQKWFPWHSSTHTLIHYRDIVPHLPLKALEYRHVGNLLLFNENNSQYTFCGTDSFLLGNTDLFEGTVLGTENYCFVLFPLSIYDHHNYLNVSLPFQSP